MRPQEFIALLLLIGINILHIDSAPLTVEEAPYLFIGRINLAVINTTFSYQPNGSDYPLTWRHALQNPVQASGLAVYNFEMSPNSMISYEADLTTVNQSVGVLNFNPIYTPSYISQIAFTIIIVQQGNYYAELFIHNGTVPQCTSTPTLTSSKFKFVGGSKAEVFCWSQSTIFTSIGNFSEVYLDCSLGGSSPTAINLRYCYATKMFSSVKITVMVFEFPKEFNKIPFYRGYIDVGTSNYIALTYAPNLNVPSFFGSTIQNYFYCIYGLSSIDGNRTSGPIFLFNANGSAYDSIAYRMFGARVQIVCLLKCPYGYEVGTNPYSCSYINCSYYMQFCGNCTNGSVCLGCYLGQIVEGGCTDMIGCIEVYQLTSTTGPIHRCSKCDEYHKLNDLGVCQCKDPTHSAGLFCTNVTGCMSTILNGDNVTCVFCNLTEYFQYDSISETCLCQDGFSLSENICQDICGDGMVFFVECDDGNNIDGDGCSSSCMVEKFYQCRTNSTSTPSLCRFKGITLKATLVSTTKTKNSNQGIFTFEFSSVLPPLEKYDYSPYFSFNCPSAEYQVQTWTYSQGQVVLTVDFFTDLEGQQAEVVFAFNQDYVYHQPISVIFSVQSDGVMLTVESSSTKTILDYFFLVSAALTCLVLIFGSWAQKMIGVELIAAFQLVYFTHFTTNNYSSTFQSIQMMSPIGLSLLFLQGNSNIDFFGDYQKEEFSIQTAEYIMVGGSSCLLALGILLGTVKLLSLYFQRLSSLAKKIYTYLVFPVTLSLYLPLLLIITPFLSRTNTEHLQFDVLIRAPSILLIILAEAAVFGYEIVQYCRRDIYYIKSNSQVNPKECYISAFLLYLFCQQIILISWLEYGQNNGKFVIFALLFSILIWQIVIRPYPQFIDNLAICLNIVLGIVFQVFLYMKSQQLVFVGEKGDTILCLTTASLMGLCQLLALIRIIKAIVKGTCGSQGKVVKAIKTKKKGVSLKRYEEHMTKTFQSTSSMRNEHFLHYINQEDGGKLQNGCSLQEDQELRLLKEKLIGDLYIRRNKEKLHEDQI